MMGKLYTLYLGGVLSTWTILSAYVFIIHSVDTFSDNYRVPLIVITLAAVGWPVIPVFAVFNEVR